MKHYGMLYLRMHAYFRLTFKRSTERKLFVTHSTFGAITVEKFTDESRNFFYPEMKIFKTAK